MKDPSKLVIKAFDFRLMDIGTSGYTEYETDADLGMFMFDNNYVDNIKMGHMHSHHTMKAYFSGTDNGELIDNAPNHNIYLSLIVNNKMENVARIAYVVKSNIGGTVTVKDIDGSDLVQEYQDEDYIEYLDANIEYDQPTMDFTNLEVRIKELRPKPKSYGTFITPGQHRQSVYGLQQTLKDTPGFEIDKTIKLKQFVSKFLKGVSFSGTLQDAMRELALAYPSSTSFTPYVEKQHREGFGRRAYETVFGLPYKQQEYYIILLEAIMMMDDLTYCQYHFNMLMSCFESFTD